MNLDLRTIYVVTAVACLTLGFLQLIAFATQRFERWPAFWGLSNILIGLGALGVGFRDFVPNVLSIQVANAVTLMGYGLLVIAVRMFAGRETVWWRDGSLLGLAVVPTLALWSAPQDFAARIALVSVVCVVFDDMIMREGVRLARFGQLASAWILVGLFGLTASLFLLRTGLALTNQFGGATLFASGRGNHQWAALTAEVFVTLRGFTLLLMAAERSRNLLVALAQQDALTGAVNLGGLRLSFDQLARPRAGRLPASVSLLLIDIDHFKEINDLHGHHVGDDVLRLLVSVARKELRSTDTLARHGGDEFAVVLPEANLTDAMAVAERIRVSFSKEANSLAIPQRPTLSVGVAEGEAGSGGLDLLLKKADDALYRSKRRGRDMVLGHDADRGSDPGSLAHAILGTLVPRLS